MHSYWRNMYLASPKRGSTFRAAGHLGISAGQCASCNNKAFLPIMDSHRFSWAGSGRILKFGPACNSGPASEWSHAGKVQQAVTVTMKCAIWDCVLVLFSTVLLSCFKLDLYCLYAIHSCLCRVYTVVFILWLLYIVTCAVVRVKSWSWSWPWNKKSRLGLDQKVLVLVLVLKNTEVLVLVLVLRPRVLVLVLVLTKKSYLHHCVYDRPPYVESVIASFSALNLRMNFDICCITAVSFTTKRNRSV